MRYNSFPYVARLVDRGPVAVPNSDIGAMELYADPVIISDPFKTFERIKKAF